MKEFKSVDDILDFALDNEQSSADLYLELSEKMDKPESRHLFKELYKEELVHKKKIMDMKKGKMLESDSKKIMDLKIADYIPEIKPADDMDYQAALAYAMQAEKAEFKLYIDLASRTDNASIKETLLSLAQEEAKHKLKLEIEYDEYVYTEG